MIKKALLLFLSFIIAANVLYAQQDEGKSGTVYSRFGTGLPLLNNTALEKSMGIMGVSFNELGSPGLANPAFWGLGVYSRVSANFDFTSYSIEDGQTSGSNSLLKIGSFQAVFPISKNKLGLSIALYPETRSSYNVNSIQSVIFGDETVDVISNRTGTGGITKFEVGLGYNIFKNLAVGYAPSYSFLTEKENESVVIQEVNNSSNTVTRRTNGTSASHRFGILFTGRNLFNSSDLIRIGGAITLPTDFSATRKTETTKVVGTQQETVQLGGESTGNVGLPLKIGGGISYFVNSKFNASAEVQVENWDEAEYGFSARDENAFKNRRVMGIGFQYHPYKERSSNFLSRFKYSAGLSHDTGHLSINNNEIETLWFSAGLGLISPNFRSSSSFDLSFQYGIRGTTDQNLVKENIFSINLSVNLTELMFLQRKLN